MVVYTWAFTQDTMIHLTKLSTYYSYVYLSDPPDAPRDFILEPALTLEWNRPTNIPGPENVDVNYTITINSIEDDIPPMNYQNFTSMISLSVVFLEEIISAQGSQCVEFEFIINATNDAGTGPSTRFIDTVPICKSIIYLMLILKCMKVYMHVYLYLVASGVAGGDVGSSTPNPYTSAPTLPT